MVARFTSASLATTSPSIEVAARQLQEGGAPPPVSYNNADAGGVDAIIKSGSAPEILVDRHGAVNGRTLDRETLIDEASNTDTAPVPIMTSPSFLVGHSPKAV